MCAVTKWFQYWGRQDSEEKLRFCLGFKSVILQMSEPDEGQEGWEHGTIARVRLECWEDREELREKGVLLCNSLRYLSTMLVFYVLHQEIEPRVTDINPAPIIIRSHNTLKLHIYWHSWQSLSPGDANRQQQEPLQRQDWLFLSSTLTLISDQPEKRFLHTKREDNHHFCITGCLGKKEGSVYKIWDSCRHFHQKPLKQLKIHKKRVKRNREILVVWLRMWSLEWSWKWKC